jgi:hypothetical protein
MSYSRLHFIGVYFDENGAFSTFKIIKLAATVSAYSFRRKNM